MTMRDKHRDIYPDEVIAQLHDEIERLRASLEYTLNAYVVDVVEGWPDDAEIQKARLMLGLIPRR